MKYAAFHSTERGFKTQREARAWIARHAEENDGETTARAWRVVGVTELRRKRKTRRAESVGAILA